MTVITVWKIATAHQVILVIVLRVNAFVQEMMTIVIIIVHATKESCVVVMGNNECDVDCKCDEGKICTDGTCFKTWISNKRDNLW